MYIKGIKVSIQHREATQADMDEIKYVVYELSLQYLTTHVVYVGHAITIVTMVRLHTKWDHDHSVVLSKTAVTAVIPTLGRTSHLLKTLLLSVQYYLVSLLLINNK